MLRDLTMIFSVLVSVASLGFGVYKNIEAGNARGFAYEQSYRVLDAVQDADIPASTKASILSTALDEIATPPPVLDLSRSSADVGQPPGSCTDDQKRICAGLARTLGEENAACAIAKDPGCPRAQTTKENIIANRCFGCF